MPLDLAGVWSYQVGSRSEGIRRLLQLAADGSFVKQSWWVEGEAARRAVVETGHWSLSQDGSTFIETVRTFDGKPSSETNTLSVVVISKDSLVLKEPRHGIEYKFQRVRLAHAAP